MDATPPNMTVPIEEPQWNSGAAWKLPGWAEPVVRTTRGSHVKKKADSIRWSLVF